MRDKFSLANTKTFPSYDQKEMLFGYWLACLLACNDYTADDGDGATLYWKYFRLFVLLQSYKVNIIIALLNGQEQHSTWNENKLFAYQKIICFVYKYPEATHGI